MQISSRQFNQNIGKAQKAAQKEPVFITNRGVPTYVLLTKAEYDRITVPKKNALDVLMSLPNVDSDIELECGERSEYQRLPMEFEE